MDAGYLDRLLRENSPDEKALLTSANKQPYNISFSEEEIRTLIEADLERKNFSEATADTFFIHYAIKKTQKPGPSPIPINKDLYTYGIKLQTDDQGTGKWLAILRHNRYYYCTNHRHTFIEMNYLYSGECVNIANGIRQHMQAGDILIMEPGCRHEVGWLNENDILINILLFPVFTEAIWDRTVTGSSIISEFLISALSKGAVKSNFLFIKSRDNKRIQNTVINLLGEYYGEHDIASDVLIDTYAQELFALLMRESKVHPENISYAYKPNSVFASMMEYIKENCITCTRESVAKEFSYSVSGMRRILYEHTGCGFVQLRNNFRLDLAEKRLNATNLPVKRIAEECGFSNYTQFYKLYKEYFGRFPRQAEALDQNPFLPWEIASPVPKGYNCVSTKRENEFHTSI